MVEVDMYNDQSAVSLDTADSFANFAHISVAQVRKMTRLTSMPRVKIGRAVRFDRAKVLAWLEGRASHNGKAASE